MDQGSDTSLTRTKRDEVRLAVLDSFDVDTLQDDPELDAIVSFAAQLCDMPVAQISLVERERQRFLAGEGLDVKETPREHSFCDHAMRRKELMEVRDTRQSETFADNPLVTGSPNIGFYAGQPLISEEGAPLGALCVVDTKPHKDGLNDFQREGMRVLAQAVMRRLSAHREMVRATRAIAQREEQLRTLADSMPAIVWSADAAGKFDYFNQGLVDFIGNDDQTGAAIHPDDFERCDSAWKESLATGEPYEVEHRLKHVDGSYRWMLSRAIPARNDYGEIVRWFGTAVDIDAVHKLSESRDLLSKELAHRIKNIFAVVIGLVSLQARQQPDHKEFSDALIETLRALGRAHDFVRPAGGDTRGSLRGLLDVLFAPYGSDRIRVDGDESAIAPRAATPLALVFHELATNSAKYGALSADGGQVTLDVTDQPEQVNLLWRESGGPAPRNTQNPDGAGFGSRLVEMSVTGQLGGSWERRFEPEGLVVELTVSKDAIAP